MKMSLRMSMLFGAMVAVTISLPAQAQQDNCYNEVDDGSGQPRCTVVGGGGTPAGGGGTDPRWVYGRGVQAQSVDEGSLLEEAIQAGMNEPT